MLPRSRATYARLFGAGGSGSVARAGTAVRVARVQATVTRGRRVRSTWVPTTKPRDGHASALTRAVRRHRTDTSWLLRDPVGSWRVATEHQAPGGDMPA